MLCQKIFIFTIVVNLFGEYFYMKICIEYEKLVEIVGLEDAQKVLDYYLRCRKKRGRPRKHVDPEKVYKLLKRYNNKSVVAKLLGISRPTLYKILKQLERM